MSSHTPGPWGVGIHEDTKEIGIVGPICGIAQVFAETGMIVGIPLEQAMANALVMAAAPDLLIACKAAMCIEMIWCPSDEQNSPEHSEEVAALYRMRQMFKEAIAKATGKAVSA